ncbi:MAG: type II toxin-antitoxin system VapC family toxin [Verrucomicrobiota bacterium]
MRYLLDTHVLLWWRQDDPRLPHRWDRVLGAPEEHELLFSVVSIWEIAIKRSLGKLRMDISTEAFAGTLVSQHGFRRIPLEVHEIARIEKLPDHHRDPFDRLLIAQAIELRATALTNDAHWPHYPIETAF